MQAGRFVFAQLMDHLPACEFTKCVARSRGNYEFRGFSIEVSGGKLQDVNILDSITPEPASFYVMDRACVDSARLYALHSAGSFFVTRAKRGILFRRRYSHPVDESSGLRSDQTVVLAAAASRKNYPDALRRIRFHDAEKDRHLRFLTNNFDLPALTICLLYKSRWAVELFFKWIKTHLRTKALHGYGENAVKTPIWIAEAVYVLVAILKKRLALQASLHEILQVLGLTLFEQVLTLQAFGELESQEEPASFSNQLTLSDL